MLYMLVSSGPKRLTETLPRLQVDLADVMLHHYSNAKLAIGYMHNLDCDRVKE